MRPRIGSELLGRAGVELHRLSICSSMPSDGTVDGDVCEACIRERRATSVSSDQPLIPPDGQRSLARLAIVAHRAFAIRSVRTR
jgi:hypothetical protein